MDVLHHRNIEETLAVSATGIIVDNKHKRPLLLERLRHRLTEGDLRKALAPGEKSPSGRKGQKSVQRLLQRKLHESVV